MTHKQKSRPGGGGDSETGSCVVADLNSENSKSKPHSQALHYGNDRAPLARVIPDSRWPDMWRIVWPNGTQSDIVNLSRAKDAAQAIAERGPPARNRQRFHWRQDRSNSRSEPRPCVESGGWADWPAEIAPA